MSTLVIENLHVWYGDTHAVNDVSLRVEDGELCVFLGPSGCGKTSTLRSVAGLVRPQSGRILIDGQLVNDLYPGERDIAMVFQSYALYPHMTVREHWAFPLKALRVPKGEMDQRIEEMANLLQMHDLLDRYPRSLSAGQAQRVAIGRALIRKPRLWLLDEPLNSLDARLQVETRAVLKRIQRETGITTIYVTHNQEEAQSLADKIIIMNDGRIQQVGSPQEVYDEPVNLFVAGFVGTPPMNFLRCTVRREAERAFLISGDLRLALRPDLAARLQAEDGQEVILGVRPEDVQVLPICSEEPNGRLHARVFVLEPQGNEVIVSLHLPPDVLWKARLDAKGVVTDLVSDQKVELDLRQHRLHVFDAKTEARLL